ncbi:unnamed protein product, partial [Ectocarpus sp. 12 AP-2014]
LADELNTRHTAKFPSRGSRRRNWGVLACRSLRTSTTDAPALREQHPSGAKHNMVYTVTLTNPLASRGEGGELLMECVVKEASHFAAHPRHAKSGHDVGGIKVASSDGGDGHTDSGEAGCRLGSGSCEDAPPKMDCCDMSVVVSDDESV